METKISMKTIYLILVITIGLVGLGIGSTLAVFTASAEISNPISFSSNLSYNGDIFDTVEVTIGPNATRTTNVSIFNDEQIDGVKYAVWYIYEGNSNDISFVRNQESDIDPSGTDIGQGGTLSMDIKNNTSNTITITIGVTTSKEDIVLPSYMKVITLATVAKYNLTLSKGTGVSTIYYRVNGATNYSSSTASKTVAVKYGTTYYYYGTASTGYTMSSCTLSSPCSGTMGAGAVTKSLTATANSYNLTLNKGTGVSTIYYKVNGASSYTSSTSNKTLSVKYGTTYYYYGTASTGYTMNSCTSSSPCSGTMGTSAVTKTLTAKSSGGSGPFTVTLYVDDTLYDTASVSGGNKYEKYFTAPTSSMTCTCTNGQTCSISHSSGVRYIVTINSVSANTTCRVEY